MLDFRTHQVGLKNTDSTDMCVFLKESMFLIYFENSYLVFQNYEKAYKQLLACDWLKNINNRKSKHHQVTTVSSYG